MKPIVSFLAGGVVGALCGLAWRRRRLRKPLTHKDAGAGKLIESNAAHEARNLLQSLNLTLYLLQRRQPENGAADGDWAALLSQCQHDVIGLSKLLGAPLNGDSQPVASYVDVVHEPIKPMQRPTKTPVRPQLHAVSVAVAKTWSNGQD